MPSNLKQQIRNRTFIFSLLLGLNFPYSVSGQDFFLPVDATSQIRMERVGLHRQAGLHMGIKPVLALNASTENIEGIGRDTTLYYYKILEKIFSEHLIEIRKPGFKLNADFLFDFGFGGELEGFDDDNANLFQNTRGFAVGGQIGEKVFFYTDFRENQARFPDYMTRFVDSLQVVPGNGRVKPFKESGFDYNMANGYVGINATDWLALSFGHFKHFIGHGHRSLLLSDNTMNYPFASYKLSFAENKIQYTYTIALMQSLDRLPAGDTPESLFQRKLLSYNYLSYKPSENFEIGIFESLIWKRYDDSTGTVPFNYSALTPIPMVNTARYGLQNADHNALLGLNVAWHPTKKLSLFGQYMLDDLDIFRAGYQIGTKYRGLFERFDIHLEYNKSEAASYAAQVPLQSFSHTNQSLAHPLGAGFEEWNLMLTFLHKRWLIRGQVVVASFENNGRSPLLPESDETFFAEENLNYQDLRISYVFNPRTNMQLYAGLTNRIETQLNAELMNQFWYIGIRTRIANMYNDF